MLEPAIALLIVGLVVGLIIRKATTQSIIPEPQQEALLCREFSYDPTVARFAQVFRLLQRARHNSSASHHCKYALLDFSFW